jgi:hypothetical protein
MAELGELGDPCASCGTTLDTDQRYCLECGTRRGDARLPFEQYLPGGLTTAADNGGGAAEAPPAGPGGRQNEPSPVGAVIGVALLGTMLLLGVLLGRGGDDATTAAPAPVVVGETTGTAGTNGGGSAETVSNTKVISEWPKDKDGWTVELGSLPKDGTTSADVEATKRDLTGKGATDLGVLDSDLYASLPAGNYVIYSGVYDSKGDAEKALKNLGGDLPDATVVGVSTEKSSSGGGDSGGGGGDTSSGGGALLSGGNGGGGDPGDTVEASEADLEALQNTTGDDYQDQLNQIPDTIATPGDAPPDDPSVEPGGGTGDGVVIR